jgi:FAD/FMN-containing dehydrogenase
MTLIESLINRLGDIPVITHPKLVRAKSRDFFWYSPILKQKLDHVTAQAVVSPGNEAEVLQVLTTCWDLDIPVTPRGGGTGNYGQAMPLAGGIVLDMTRMNQVKRIGDGVLVVESGALMGEIEDQTRADSGQELRIHPSTRETATIGGFIAGGSGGVGSIRWGMLREPGNILRLRLATMEKQPRLVELTGDDIALVHHSYGVNGIITEVEIPLAPAQDWVEILVAFDDWMVCLRTGWAVAHHEGLWLKQLAAVQSPAPENYFTRHRKFIHDGDNLLCILAAPNAMGPLAQELSKAGGRIAFRSDTASAEEKDGLPRLHHLTWNHTTLRALKTDPEMTYLQVGTPAADPLGSLDEIARRYPGEIIGHVEYIRSAGQVYATFLPIYRFSGADRLNQVVRDLEALGCPCYNPHAYTFEEGNRTAPDPARLALKREYDPKGLMNPGKMIGCENPDYQYDPTGSYAYPGLQKAAP